MTDRSESRRAGAVQPRYFARIAHQDGERSHSFPRMKRQETDVNIKSAASTRCEQETRT